MPLAIATTDTQGYPRSNWAAPCFYHSSPPHILKPDPQPTSDHKAGTVLKIGSQPPHSPATCSFMVLCGLESWLLVIPQSQFCGTLHDSTGVRAYMAGIYEKQEAIKVLILTETEERHDSPISTCYGQAKGWLAFAMKSSKNHIFGLVFKRQRHSPLGYTEPFPKLRKLWTKSFVRNYPEEGWCSPGPTIIFSRQFSGWVGKSVGHPKGYSCSPLAEGLLHSAQLRHAHQLEPRHHRGNWNIKISTRGF